MKALTETDKRQTQKPFITSALFHYMENISLSTLFVLVTRFIVFDKEAENMTDLSENRKV